MIQKIITIYYYAYIVYKTPINEQLINFLKNG